MSAYDHPTVLLDAEDEYDHCCQCGAEKPDTVGLSLIETEEEEAEEYGFCSLPCLAVFVQKHYAGLVPSTPAKHYSVSAPAAAAGSGSPSAVGDPPAATGAAQGRGSLGSARPVQAAPTSEAGA